MFTKFDLIIGAVGIRLLRKYKKIRNIPDVVFVKKNLSLGGKTTYEDLSKMNIDTVIDLRAEIKEEFEENNSFSYHKIGIIDGSVPTESQINQIHKIIDDCIKQDKIVFVHCNLGRGRATLVTLSYLLREEIDWETALTVIKKRKFVYLNNKQLNFLKKWSNGQYK